MAKQVIELTDENFQTEIAQGATLVDFHATWCGPCRMIAPVIEQLAEKMVGRMKVAKLDIDQAERTTAALQITSVPTLILFKEGREIKRSLGVKDLNALTSWVEAAL